METLSRLTWTLRETCARLPDKRTGNNARYAMADIGMAAFSVFFMQSPSFLAHQRQLQEGPGHGRSNCETLFEMTGIPCDNHIRAMLDPVEPKLFFLVLTRHSRRWTSAVGLTRSGSSVGMYSSPWTVRSISVPTTFIAATAPHAPVQAARPNIFTRFFSATIVAPGHNRVVSLPPEFISPQDSSEKQDCESRAARRWFDGGPGKTARYLRTTP